MTSGIAPPPQALTVDDYSAANAARQRFVKKSRLPISISNLHHTFLFSGKTHSNRNSSVFSTLSADDVTVSEDEEDEDLAILFRRPHTAEYADDYHAADRYQWAVLYENQRGVTLFSIPYYSKLSLLPIDPYPFTIPSTSHKRSKQPNYTLTEYPLPDGTWRWVSKTWMIDMQNDSGNVQHDGFEYNWFFQKHHWRAQVGNMSAGGYVRRRRWIRLMMRPGRVGETEEDLDQVAHVKSRKAEHILRNRISLGSTLEPASIVSALSDDPSVDDEVLDAVWFGDDVEDHWKGYCSVMKAMGRDGRKLELWRRWLGLDKEVQKPTKQWSEDEALLPSQLRVHGKPYHFLPPRPYVEILLRNHGVEVLHSFIYPASRAQLLHMLDKANLLSVITSDNTLRASPSTSMDLQRHSS